MHRSFLFASAAAFALLFTPACERISAEKVFPEYMAQKKAAKKDAMKEIESLNHSSQEAPGFFHKPGDSGQN